MSPRGDSEQDSASPLLIRLRLLLLLGHVVLLVTCLGGYFWIEGPKRSQLKTVQLPTFCWLVVLVRTGIDDDQTGEEKGSRIRRHRSGKINALNDIRRKLNDAR